MLSATVAKAIGNPKRPPFAGFFMADERKTSAQRGYGSRWQRARETFLRNHPLCAMHMGRGQVVPASVVDHIIPHRGDNALFWDHENWQALCADCHDRHKQMQERSGRIVGCDLGGIPDDPRHHWRKG